MCFLCRAAGFVEESRMISGYTILNSFIDTENAFLDAMQRALPLDRGLAISGSCCLVAVLTGKGILHLANLGDSQAVLGYLDNANTLRCKQLTVDQDINDKTVRKQFKSMHPGNDRALEKVHGVWCINGLRKVTGSIGDGTLKRDSLAIYNEQYKVNEEFHRPLMNAVPTIHAIKLGERDRFVIFATSGFWHLMSNQEAAAVVNDGNQGAAKRLIEAALRNSAARSGVSFEALIGLAPGDRSLYHDDISVIVLFVDDNFFQNPMNVPANSVVGFVSVAAPPEDTAAGLVSAEENAGLENPAGLVNLEENAGLENPAALVSA